MANKSVDDVSNEVLDGPQLEEREKARATQRKFLEELTFSAVDDTPDTTQNQGRELGDKFTSTLTVTSGNFRGELTFQYWWSATHFYFKTSQYRITRSNGQSGGNKANVNIVIDNSAGQWRNKSPDALWQDGEWHSYVRETDLRVWDKWATVYVTFIFDKGGDDPRGTTYKQYINYD